MTDTPAESWANAIVDFDPAVDPTSLTAHPLNARLHPEHQRRALRESLSRVGWVDVVKVNTQTGNVVDGHARVEEALAAGETVPVLWVDLEPEQERFVLATLDPISSMATYDREILDELVAGLEIQTDALNDMLGAVTSHQPLMMGPAELPEGFAGMTGEGGGGDGEEPGGFNAVSDADKGASLALLDNVTMDVPSGFQVANGERWTCGQHVLWCLPVITGWPKWSADLTSPDDLFIPYPGPYVPLTEKAEERRMVMVQPNPFLAGHVLAKYAAVKGADTVERSDG